MIPNNVKRGGPPRWWRRLRSALDRTCAAGQLRHLSDASLRDIGLSRPSLPTLVQPRRPHHI